MANPVREFFVSKPEAARVVLVDTSGDIYNATGGSSGGDVNIAEVGGNPIGATVPISGTVSVSGTVTVDEPVSVTGPLTDAELRATPVPVSGTVSVNEPVTVDATDLDIRNLAFATDLDIRNLVFATDKVDVSGSSSVGVTGPLTDTQLRATPVPISGTVTVGTITAGDNTIGRVKITDGTDVALVTAAGEQNVLATAQPGVDIGDVTINNASGGSAVNIQDGGNTITVDGTVSVNLNAGTNTNEVVGDVAADAPAAGNPVLIAASSETMADSAPANRVSQDADATRISATDGAIFVIPTGPQTWTYHEDSSSALTDAVVHAAPASGLSLYVTDIVFSSGAATANNIFFEEGSTKVLGPWYLEAVAGRGLAIHFGTPKKITAATALTVTTSAAIAHGLDVQGFIAPG